MPRSAVFQPTAAVSVAAVVVVVAAVAGLAGCGSAPAAGGAGPSSDPAAAATAASAAPSAVATSGVATSAGAPSTITPTPARRPSSKTVVLDPGHNGGNAAHPEVVDRPVPAGRGQTKPCNTTGTSTDAGYPEHAFTWDVALRVRELLAAQGVRVVLTRPDDHGVGPCVDERARLADAAQPDAVVSIHADGAAATGHGFHVAYSDPPLNAAQGEPARSLATALRDAMRGGGFPTADYIGSAGLDGRDDLAGLNLAHHPSALVECANMRNPAEAAAVSSPAARARYAAAIATGILTWLAAH
jgi:N-acetylmuramoyl-L-alanine amidase